MMKDWCAARAQRKGTWLLLVPAATADAGAVQKLLQIVLDPVVAHLDQIYFAGTGRTGGPALRGREALLFPFLPLTPQILLCMCSVCPL